MFNLTRYDHKYQTTSQGDFTDLFDRKLNSASRFAGTWRLEDVIALLREMRRTDRALKGPTK